MDIKKIQNDVGYRSYFRSILLQEYKRDSWFTAAETAPALGVKTDDPVLRYIRAGWLEAVKRPVNIDGQWIIRKSAIDKFLALDLRGKRQHELLSLARHNDHLGRIYMTTELLVKTCPSNASPNGAHRWDIDRHHHGRCAFCGEEKEFRPFINISVDRVKPFEIR